MQAVMAKVITLCLLSIGVFTACCFATPLDDYVNAPDPTYSWSVNNSFHSILGFTTYNILLTSQKWMTEKQSDRPIWQHWLQICVPDMLDTKLGHNAFMYIDGGHNGGPPPNSLDALSEVVCVTSRTISAALLEIPNEPIQFANDSKRRSEDALIAYTWSYFLNHTNEPIWLARLPMVKAAVKAMDAIQEFVKQQTKLGVEIQNFVVAGASKRGWTTWLTGAVDKRVVAIVPMVMPILNIVPNMNHHYQAYGGWSFALDDYLQMGLMAYLNKPEFLDLAAVVDPWSYRDRLTMPKLIMCAAGDEFFLPDSPQFFMDGLVGEKLLTVIPDAEHSLATALIEVGSTISAFYDLIITKQSRPVYSYTIVKSNSTAKIIVKTDPAYPPSAVTMWYAHTLSSTLRDFRLVTCDKIPDCIQPVIWWPQDLTQQEDGTYVAQQNAPWYGWVGFLVELTYTYGLEPNQKVLKVSTEVNIVPDVMPFPPCGQHCQ